MTYVLDANVFIQAKNLHYGFDFCPAFWDWLDSQAASAAVMSIEKVGPGHLRARSCLCHPTRRLRPVCGRRARG